MHPGSSCPPGCAGDGGAPPCRAHCFVPVTPSVACCPRDGSPAPGLCLPSSQQGTLWLLGVCQDSCGDTGGTLSCGRRTCSAGWDPGACRVPCDSPAEGTARGARNAAHAAPSASRGPRSRAGGCAACFCTPGLRAPAARLALGGSGSRCRGRLSRFSDSLRPRRLRGPGPPGYSSCSNLGFLPGGFSPSCYRASAGSCRSQNYVVRSCRYPRHGPLSCQPRGYPSRTFRAPSGVRSTFPPLRYLGSGVRPWPRC